MATAFENMTKADNIAVNVRKWILETVPHTRLGRQIYNALWPMDLE